MSADAITELETLAKWVRSGDYNADDARDEIARAIENRARGLRAEVSRKKSVYVGAPACFALELACQHINNAFGDFGCYLVGSALERPDWRDIDVRYIMKDEAFRALFPDAYVEANGVGGAWEQDPRWLLLTVSISSWLKEQTGLPIDFQIQPQSHANERHKGQRSALGMRIGNRQ